MQTDDKKKYPMIETPYGVALDNVELFTFNTKPMAPEDKEEIRNRHDPADGERWAKWVQKRFEYGYKTPIFVHHTDIPEPTKHDPIPWKFGDAFIRNLRMENIYQPSVNVETKELEFREEPTLVGMLDGMTNEQANDILNDLYPNGSLGLRFDEESQLWEIGHYAILPEEIPYHKHPPKNKNTIIDKRKKLQVYTDAKRLCILRYDNYGGPGSGRKPDPNKHDEDTEEHKNIDKQVASEIEKSGLVKRTWANTKEKLSNTINHVKDNIKNDGVLKGSYLSGKEGAAAVGKAVGKAYKNMSADMMKEGVPSKIAKPIAAVAALVGTTPFSVSGMTGFGGLISVASAQAIPALGQMEALALVKGTKYTAKAVNKVAGLFKKKGDGDGKQSE